jgi:tetratricopeptide (TPR) repeat protein
MKKILLFLFVFSLLACSSPREEAVNEIARLESELKSDSSFTPSEDKAAAMMKAYMDFAVAYPTDSSSPEYLFRAADLAQGIHHESVAVRLYEQIRKDYPSYSKAAACLFMEAFVLDYNLGEKDKAKQKYAEFIAAYPDHSLTASAKASLDQLNLGLTDEELVRSWEEKQMQDTVQ